MTGLAAYPLTWPANWPRMTSRKRASFTKCKNRLTVHDGVYRVLGELAHFRVARDDIIISTNVRTRLDGTPRSDQPEPSDPGVAVYWEDRAGYTKVMAIDRYDRVADNLAAIAATLEAMRAIERHGGAMILERAFTGFTALPPPKTTCWDVLGIPPTKDEDAIMARFRWLAKLHHPDNGGDHARMTEIIEARDQAMERIHQGAR
jgi:hypothetical protein